MPNPLLVATFLREIAVRRTLPREPEPELVMLDEEQVAAYAEAGRIDGVMAAAYLFHSARVTKVISGRKRVLDLGCGPATQLAQIAQFNPETEFVGIDLSEPMLDQARNHIKTLGLSNVTFRQADITSLNGISDGTADAVISTMALHHLPTYSHLNACFAAIRRVLVSNGALYITDFGRLKSLKSVISFAYANAKNQPHMFSLDYERSLRAAFVKEDFEALSVKHFPGKVRVFCTYKVPFLVIIQTPDFPVQKELRERFRGMRAGLQRRYRRDLDDLRRFFALGGLRDDPFA